MVATAVTSVPDSTNPPTENTTVEQSTPFLQEQEEEQLAEQLTQEEKQSQTSPGKDEIPDKQKPDKSSSKEEVEEATKKEHTTGTLTIHFLDVGQADSILIELLTGKNILIDAGNNDDSSFIVN